jgi:hypothetical protein
LYLANERRTIRNQTTPSLIKWKRDDVHETNTRNDVVFQGGLFWFIFLGSASTRLYQYDSSLLIEYSLSSRLLSDADSIATRTASLDLSHSAWNRKCLNVTKNAGIAYGERHNSKSQKLYSQQIATIEQRLCKGPCPLRPEYDIRVFPDQISIVPGSFRPKYKPKNRNGTQIVPFLISVSLGFQKPVVHKCTQFENHTDAVQYGKHKEECASEGDYRYDFEGWDDVSILENRTKPRIHSLSQRELFKVSRSCFQKRRSGILDPSRRKKPTRVIDQRHWVLPLSQNHPRVRGYLSLSSSWLVMVGVQFLENPRDWPRGVRVDQVGRKITDRLSSFTNRSVPCKASGACINDYYQRFTINSPRKLVGLYGRECSLHAMKTCYQKAVDKQGVYSISSTILLVLTAHFDPHLFCCHQL